MKQPIKTVGDRLIVAADSYPYKMFQHPEAMKNRTVWLHEILVQLKAEERPNFKLGSVIRYFGEQIIARFHKPRLPFFVDTKINDIPATLQTDGWLLQTVPPPFLTVMCSAGLSSLKALREMLPRTEILGITTLQHQSDEEIRQIYNESRRDRTIALAEMAAVADLDGLICIPSDIEMLRTNFGRILTLNAENVHWNEVPGPLDDQHPNRSGTIRDAFVSGADRVIVGQPITLASDPLLATRGILTKIEKLTAVPSVSSNPVPLAPGFFTHNFEFCILDSHVVPSFRHGNRQYHTSVRTDYSLHSPCDCHLTSAARFEHGRCVRRR
jgi:orotidine-5'-phosphate decarboxylase